VLISAGGEAEARFRVPVVPMLAIAAAAGVSRVSSKPSSGLPAGLPSGLPSTAR